MNKNMLLMLAALGAAVIVMNRARAATAPAGSASAPIQSKNVNDQLWTAVLGGGWRALADAQNADGSPAFLMKNWLGQTVTSDGKPVGQEYQDLTPATYGEQIPIDLGAASGGVDYLEQLGW